MPYELKTKKNNASVSAFINSVEDPKKKKDSKEINKLFKEITGEKPKMWGGSIIGYGSYSYESKSGIKGEWMLTGFSPRKQNISLYVMTGLDTKENKELLKKLGKYKTGKSCLYINSLEDIDIKILKKLLKDSYKQAKKGNKIC